MMYYLDVYLGKQVQLFCSKDISLLLEVVREWKEWSISSFPREAEKEVYLQYEVTHPCIAEVRH